MKHATITCVWTVQTLDEQAAVPPVKYVGLSSLFKKWRRSILGERRNAINISRTSLETPTGPFLFRWLRQLGAVAECANRIATQTALKQWLELDTTQFLLAYCLFSIAYLYWHHILAYLCSLQEAAPDFLAGQGGPGWSHPIRPSTGEDGGSPRPENVWVK